MYAYSFNGYWKDVGTISSLLEANMDLLGDNPELVLNDEEWRIYSRHEAHAPQFVGRDAVVKNSSITEGCEIYGTVINSVIGAGVHVAKNAVIKDSVIMEDVYVHEGANISYSVIDEKTVIGANCRVGIDKDTAKGITVIGSGLEIKENTVIHDGAMISKLSDIKEGK